MIDLPIFKTTSGQTITKFQPQHLNRLDLREPERSEVRDDPLILDRIAQTADPLASWTGMFHGKPVVCFGIRTVSPGVGEAWLLPGVDIDRHAISVCRGSRKIYQHFLDERVFRRIHVVVDPANDTAFRFAKWNGFDVEGIMRKFGANGSDHLLMARISEHGLP
ncbi:hypothetical protein UFOVP847_40 [uncultured Caudovirales phage]|uniref:N-acetyltransferase domain-containing protein n=1 Tax=uncultured Caudovirales phage TaxID=2100421 RepID=A0A6J5P9H1_9CAUD|nr:hypothetical protein UFOVP847_40 [uncultured Caudovirales phage]